MLTIQRGSYMKNPYKIMTLDYDLRKYNSMKK